MEISYLNNENLTGIIPTTKNASTKVKNHVSNSCCFLRQFYETVFVNKSLKLKRSTQLKELNDTPTTNIKPSKTYYYFLTTAVSVRRRFSWNIFRK